MYKEDSIIERENEIPKVNVQSIFETIIRYTESSRKDKRMRKMEVHKGKLIKYERIEVQVTKKGYRSGDYSSNLIKK